MPLLEQLGVPLPVLLHRLQSWRATLRSGLAQPNVRLSLWPRRLREIVIWVESWLEGIAGFSGWDKVVSYVGYGVEIGRLGEVLRQVVRTNSTPSFPYVIVVRSIM